MPDYDRITKELDSQVGRSSGKSRAATDVMGSSNFYEAMCPHQKLSLLELARDELDRAVEQAKMHIEQFA